jgi:serine/threonine-protein kinase RsbT
MPIQVKAEEDLPAVRTSARSISASIGFGIVDQTKIVTSVSELARNMLKYAHGGDVTIEAVEEGLRRGILLVFEDQGPGISDIDQAMADGFTSGGGLGLGLGGTKRLMGELSITSAPGAGTRVVTRKWL